MISPDASTDDGYQASCPCGWTGPVFTNALDAHRAMDNHRCCVDPVGAVEIAERLGVKRGTVDMWRIRSIGFPEPRWAVGGRPAWNWSDVEAWAKAR
jgi:predicted DNA-binding transcriptional regulator AlpA